MVESFPKKKINVESLDISPNVMTGGDTRANQLYDQLIQSMRQAEEIDIIVSFLMESGVRMLLKELSLAISRGVKIRILTGNYLGITQPSALYLIKQELKDEVDLRFYNDSTRSFHAKSYLFHTGDFHEIYVGSSNISRSALTNGIEWNYRFNSIQDPKGYTSFYDTFEDLFHNHSIILDDETLAEYSRNWHQPSVFHDLSIYDSKDATNEVNPIVYEPRGAQIEALFSLEKSREEGATKALVQAATGVGKTYLAAFDSRTYKHVLFIAHRTEILNQAAVSFSNVRGNQNYGFFRAEEKCTDQPVIFASVATLGNERYLNENYFAKDYFDYIVIDECHHAVNENYRRIVDYFQPKFLLGLTATPDRMDGRNIYEICDYNVPYVITLREAINKGMLVPFHYYGIYDDIDYSSMKVVNGHYADQELDKAFLGNTTRIDLIYRHYKKYASQRALGFCCTRAHAEEMAKEFNARGIPSVAVYSGTEGTYSEDRITAIQQLDRGEIRVIFSVDMFNEGIDLPSIDMVMFLRPTESPIVFFQQLGRGLRTYEDKAYLTVLDFIGNYEKADRVKIFLRGNEDRPKTNPIPYSKDTYPANCFVDFDMRLLDLFEQMEKNRTSLRDQIHKEYIRVKEVLGRRPSRMDLFTYMDDAVYQAAVRNAKENPFKQYLKYLNTFGELEEEEVQLLNNTGGDFLHLIETTSMTKVYKMPVLMAFYNNGSIRKTCTNEELLDAWKAFFNTSINWEDLETNITYTKYQSITETQHLKKILSMPVHFLQESGDGYFVQREEYPIALSDDLDSYLTNPAFIQQFGDIIQYRAMDYYQRRYHKD